MAMAYRNLAETTLPAVLRTRRLAGSDTLELHVITRLNTCYRTYLSEAVLLGEPWMQNALRVQKRCALGPWLDTVYDALTYAPDGAFSYSLGPCAGGGLRLDIHRLIDGSRALLLTTELGPAPPGTDVASLAWAMLTHLAEECGAATRESRRLVTHLGEANAQVSALVDAQAMHAYGGAVDEAAALGRYAAALGVKQERIAAAEARIEELETEVRGPVAGERGSWHTARHTPCRTLGRGRATVACCSAPPVLLALHLLHLRACGPPLVQLRMVRDSYASAEASLHTLEAYHAVRGARTAAGMPPEPDDGPSSSAAAAAAAASSSDVGRGRQRRGRGPKRRRVRRAGGASALSDGSGGDEEEEEGEAEGDDDMGGHWSGGGSGDNDGGEGAGDEDAETSDAEADAAETMGPAAAAAAAAMSDAPAAAAPPAPARGAGIARGVGAGLARDGVTLRGVGGSAESRSVAAPPAPAAALLVGSAVAPARSTPTPAPAASAGAGHSGPLQGAAAAVHVAGGTGLLLDHALEHARNPPSPAAAAAPAAPPASLGFGATVAPVASRAPTQQRVGRPPRGKQANFEV